MYGAVRYADRAVRVCSSARINPVKFFPPRNQKTPVFAGMSGQHVLALTKSLAENETLRAWLERTQKQHPGQHRWLALKAYWQGRGRENMLGFLEHVAAAIDATITPVALVERPGLRVYSGGGFITDEAAVLAQSPKGWIAIVDHDTGDRAGDIATVNRLCAGVSECPVDTHAGGGGGCCREKAGGARDRRYRACS